MSHDVIPCHTMSYDVVRWVISFRRLQLDERTGLNISLPRDNIHLPEKNWQRPFFKVVKLNFYAVASLSFPFQISSHILTCKTNRQQQMKVFFAFCPRGELLMWSNLCRQQIIVWLNRPFHLCEESKYFFFFRFHSKSGFISNSLPALPLHWVKSNEG